MRERVLGAAGFAEDGRPGCEARSREQRRGGGSGRRGGGQVGWGRGRVAHAELPNVEAAGVEASEEAVLGAAANGGDGAESAQRAIGVAQRRGLTRLREKERKGWGWGRERGG